MGEIRPARYEKNKMNQKSFATFLLLAMLIMASGMARAQMRGGSAGGMGKGQPPSGAMQGPMAQQGTTAMGQAGTQDDRRRLMHTTSRQDHQYSACQQAMHSVQGDIGRMMHHNSCCLDFRRFQYRGGRR